MLSSLSVSPTADRNLIDVSVRWDDPGAAAVMANTFAEHYVNFVRSSARAGAERALMRAREEREAQEDKLRKLEAELLEVAHGLAPDAVLRTERSKLAEDLLVAGAEREQAQAAVRLIDAAAMSLLARPVAGDPVIQELNAQLIRARERRIALVAQYGALDRRVEAADAAIAQLLSAISDTAPRVARAFRGRLADAVAVEADLLTRVEANQQALARLEQGRQAAMDLDDRAHAQRAVVAAATAKELAARERLARMEPAARLIQAAARPAEPSLRYTPVALAAFGGFAVVLRLRPRRRRM